MIRIFVVPYDSGIKRWRMGAGPETMLAAGLGEALKNSEQSVSIQMVEVSDQAMPEVGKIFETNRVLAKEIAEARERGEFPLVLSGNCNCSIGIIAGLNEPDLIVAWFDAHGDFNTPETTLSAFLDGMALSILVGGCWRSMAKTVPNFNPLPEDRALLIGARDLDPAERELLDSSSIRRVSSVSHNVTAAIPISESRLPAHVHIDLDVLDPSEGRANCYAAPGGLSLSALQKCIEEIKQNCNVEAALLTAYDPTFDPERRIARAAVELGKQITELQ